MNLDSKLSQFIYGKFTGVNCGYDLIAWTEDLEGYQRQLKDLVEKLYQFWGSQPTGDSKAVAICPNNTKILDSKKFLLIQVSPAVNEQEDLLTSGGRRFVQHRFIFIDQASIIPFKNCNGLLLGRLLKETIPYFDTPPTNDAWNTIKTEVLHSPKITTYDEKIFFEQAPLISQSLSLILSKKRLLLTNDEGSLNPVKFLDNLLCWLPITCRRKLSLALGSVDENYCGWADLIVKTNGYPDSLPEQLIWLDRNSKRFYPNSGNVNEHSYVKNFITTPIEKKWVQVSNILQYLDTWESEEFDPNQPPLKFILYYPVNSQNDNQYKLLLLHQYSFTLKEQLLDFINLESNYSGKYLSLFWQVLQKDFLCENLIKELLMKISSLQPALFLEIVDSASFIKHVPGLLESGFFNFFDRKDVADIIESLKQACLKSIEEQGGEAKRNLILLCTKQKNIFTDAECFKLLASTLNERTTLEDRKNITISLDRIVNHSYSFEMMEIWLKLLKDSQNDTYLEQEFLAGNTWKFLDANLINSIRTKLISTYSQYVGKLIIWVNDDAQHRSLINDVLLNCIQEIWITQNSIELGIWDILIHDQMIQAFGNSYWLKLFYIFIQLSVESFLFLPPPKTSLSNDEKRFVYSDMRKMISDLDQSSVIDKMLENCKKIGLEPLAILSSVKPEIRGLLEVALKYMDDMNDVDDNFVKCLELLEQISTYDEAEIGKKRISMFNYARKIINMLQEPSKRKALEICINHSISL